MREVRRRGNRSEAARRLERRGKVTRSAERTHAERGEGGRERRSAECGADRARERRWEDNERGGEARSAAGYERGTSPSKERSAPRTKLSRRSRARANASRSRCAVKASRSGVSRVAMRDAVRGAGSERGAERDGGGERGRERRDGGKRERGTRKPQTPSFANVLCTSVHPRHLQRLHAFHFHPILT